MDSYWYYFYLEDAINYTHIEICRILDEILRDDEFVELICHGRSCGTDGGSCHYYHDATGKLSPNTKVTIFDNLFEDEYEISLEELYYYLSTACRNCVEDGQYPETMEVFCAGLEYFRQASGVKGTARKYIGRQNIQYRFYEPPLRLRCTGSEAEESETGTDIAKIKELEWEAEANGDLMLAILDYELHFELRFLDWPPGFDFAAEALPYGGRLAVLRECLKRGVKIQQLLKLDTTSPNSSAAVNRDAGSSDQAAGNDITDRFAERRIKSRKKQRERILAWQQKRRQLADSGDDGISSGKTE